MEKTEQSANAITLQALPHSELQANIVAYLFSKQEAVSLGDISKTVGMNEEAVGRAVEKLVVRGIIVPSKLNGTVKFQLYVN